MKFQLKQMFTAYRKAKREAFHDTNCAHGLKFASYEKSLLENLTNLLNRINESDPSWYDDSSFIGELTHIPKSVDPVSGKSEQNIHCQSSDPLEQWKNHYSADRRAQTEFRPVINATVDFLVLSALWILEVGHLYEAKLDTRYSFGNRLARWRPRSTAAVGATGELNLLSPAMFQPYQFEYGRWRTSGLEAMRRDLEAGHRIVAITMDIKQFYHQVDPLFLVDDRYLKTIGVELPEDGKAFTEQLIKAFQRWASLANGTAETATKGLPVGLPASSIVANVLLYEFDQRVVEELSPTYYGRYVDDVFLVVRHSKPFQDGHAVIEWIAKKLNPIATTEATNSNDKDALQIILPYAEGSNILFTGKKQKIFQLSGRHGIDLIGPIEEQIRLQTSEHRNLPHIPDTESAMAHRALLVNSDSTLEADALRKADAVTLRRSGFAMLLSDVDAHARDLDPSSWRPLRLEFYGLANRHLLTPRAFFDYYRYFVSPRPAPS